MKNLKQKLHSTFDGKGTSKDLPEVCIDLLSQQKKTWPDLREGYELLKEVRERELPCNGFSVRLQYNPGRIKSSTADVGERDVKKRSCFLCLDQLPEGQKGILYRNELLILCNPMPVLSSHLTISHIDHRRQSISENIGTLFQLVEDFGSGWVLLYNGPRCGASAPDHLHFQAIPSGRMPIEREMQESRRLTLLRQIEGVSLISLRGVGRQTLILEGENLSKVVMGFMTFLDELKKVLHIDGEPMMNIAGLHDEKKWGLIIFPRRKHRPDIFFKEGEERVVISPGVIDMGGLLITPMREDFERLDAPGIESIYGEVSLEGKIAERAIDAMKPLLP